MSKDRNRNGFRKKYSVQAQGINGGDCLYSHKFDPADSSRDHSFKASLSSNDQINLQNINKVPSYYSSSPFVKDNIINQNTVQRPFGQIHSLADASPNELAKNSPHQLQKGGSKMLDSISSKNNIMTINGDDANVKDTTPNKRKEKLLNQTLDYINHPQISPISSHCKMAS